MSSYFKYTNGESFTLNGVDYIGFFNITDNEVYTEKIKSDISEKLTPKNTFISDFYLNKLEFDNQFNITQNPIPFYSNIFEIINKNEIDKIFQIINNNNLLAFKSLIIKKPEIINFDENNSHYYGLSSTPADDLRNNDEIFGKNVISQIDPFVFYPKWNFLNNIKYGSLFVDSSESFKYLCSDGFTIYTLKGSFVTKEPLTVTEQISENEDNIFGIFYDEYENKILIVSNNKISIYNSINYIDCEELILIDEITIGDVEAIDLTWDLDREFSDVLVYYSRNTYFDGSANYDFLNIGYNSRIIIINDILEIWNKYSSELLGQIDLSKKEIINILAVDSRKEDDYTAILHQSNNQFKISFFNPFDFENTLITSDIKGLKESENYRLKFSTYDSNIIFLNTTSESQIRFVSNPSYSISKMREENLKYPEKFKFGNTFQKFDKSVIKWTTNNRDSNFFTNINFEIITNGDINYYFLLNSGRIYCMKQNIQDSYLFSIDPNIIRTFKEVECGNVSFGLFLNKNLSLIMKDLLNLYISATNSYTFDENDVFLNKINEISYDINNLYMNGNETVNVLTTQRIFDNILKLQENLIANLITSDK